MARIHDDKRLTGDMVRPPFGDDRCGEGRGREICVVRADTARAARVAACEIDIDIDPTAPPSDVIISLN